MDLTRPLFPNSVSVMPLAKPMIALASALVLVGSAPATALRVMTFNLRYITSDDKGPKAWVARRDQAAEVIKTDNPDIVGVQEALAPALNDLTDRLPGYTVLGTGRENGNDKGEYSAILVKSARFRIQKSGTFWLSATPDIPDSRTWGNRVTRICTWAVMLDRETGKPLRFFNTHLDHESPEARQKGMELILSRIAEGPATSPVVLTGDFNCVDTDTPSMAIKAGGLIDVWHALHADTPAAESGTFHQFKGTRNLARIDFIYASPTLSAQAAEIIRSSVNGNYPSDHFPVRATLGY